MARGPMLPAWIRARRVAERALAGEIYVPVAVQLFIIPYRSRPHGADSDDIDADCARPVSIPAAHNSTAPSCDDRYVPGALPDSEVRPEFRDSGQWIGGR